MTHFHRMLAAGLVASLAACGSLRTTDAYRADTAKLLATRSGQIERCYDDALGADGKAAGTVTVQFVVESDSGAISKPTVESEHSTAPPALGKCVVKALDGLVLAPSDSQEGRATFVYEFHAGQPRTAEARPAR